ncbi:MULTISPECIES: NAD(P)-binding domain-containing protein [Paracoccus]|uniref:shikimate dehydrogenase family protein n=1 Tax=Paracoccus TaxID=265 RepID=UPI000868C0C3|nr:MULTISPECIES: NAD(P)-binding domain-containing protein [Paracoccus]ODT58114.1 MAG: shikimate dehydrogenase [Paracoccus sp. SCN 68-21]
MTDTILLGLIGDNIAASQSPRLHRLAGAQNGRRVRYDSLIPRLEGLDFDALFARCAAGGYRGINVTYPYKEVVAGRLRIDDPLVAAIGACNTVLFRDGPPRGFNTDYSGFVAAYRRVRGDAAPGPVLMIGAGGVGRAVAFGLIALGATQIRLADRDPARADALAMALRAARPGLSVVTGTDAAALAVGVAGMINCTPVGMVGHDGTPLDGALMAGADWAFDAVYTPVDTQFLRDAQVAGLDIISGYELFIGQGVDAWAIFTGLPLDQDRLRADLAAGRDAS